ncbi:LysR family transcriptional regulator [Frondihabitans sucicola]|uniref:LysR family transcriptional regulator n=1 Tax=Frondihabitans sucicola TaxID=1268041 RepID=A0ABM8GR12_9MICO|nr:LysR family transcriptional regulator [Frondihabitans sucicola]BDZ50907.1 LysR family transcriptional regulator [Frondihabitans sucicola]
MSHDLDLLDLRVIRAIADTGSVTAAAHRLGYSQPAITQRLRRAEAQLGQPLVLRASRGVSLTEAGERLARHAVHVQAALDAAQQELDDLSGTTTGAVRIAGFPSASPTLVPALLSGMRLANPGLSVSYVEVEPPEALELLRSGSVDLALTFSYPGDGRDTTSPESDTVVETPLYRDTMLAVAPVGVIGEDVLASLDGARFIGGCPRCRGHLLAACRRAGFEPEIVLETDNALAVTGLVAAGLGVALLPSLSLRPAALPDGVEARALPEQDDRVVHVAHAAGAERVPAVRAALSALAALDPALFGLRGVLSDRTPRGGTVVGRG